MKAPPFKKKYFLFYGNLKPTYFISFFQHCVVPLHIIETFFLPSPPFPLQLCIHTYQYLSISLSIHLILFLSLSLSKPSQYYYGSWSDGTDGQSICHFSRILRFVQLHCSAFHSVQRSSHLVFLLSDSTLQLLLAMFSSDFLSSSPPPSLLPSSLSLISCTPFFILFVTLTISLPFSYSLFHLSFYLKHSYIVLNFHLLSMAFVSLLPITLLSHFISPFLSFFFFVVFVFFFPQRTFRTHNGFRSAQCSAVRYS